MEDFFNNLLVLKDIGRAAPRRHFSGKIVLECLRGWGSNIAGKSDEYGHDSWKGGRTQKTGMTARWSA